MARDDEFYTFAVAFPQAVLALLGQSSAEGYRASSIELKSSARRIDMVLEPVSSEGLIWILEHSRRRDPEQDRNLLKKAVDLCTERNCWTRVRCAVFFTKPAYARAVIPARLGDAECSQLIFQPQHVILPRVSPEELLRRGGSHLVALPLVGTQDQVTSGAADWLKRLDADPTLAAERDHARDVFLTLLSDRMSTMNIQQLLTQKDTMEHTATGQALIAKGIERGRLDGERALVARQVRRRLGSESPCLARIAHAGREQLEAVADLIVQEPDDAALAVALARLLPQA